MDKRNVGSLEACKRLKAAEIVVETEAYHEEWMTEKWRIVHKAYTYVDMRHAIPAPSMAEVWRLLPEELSVRACTYSLRIYRYKGRSHAGYQFYEDIEVMKDSTNPTDSLIDLLIWIEKEKKMDPRNKKFAELCGVKWHEPTVHDNRRVGELCICGRYRCDEPNPDFTSDSGKVALLRLMEKRKDWKQFYSCFIDGGGVPLIQVSLITDTTGLLIDKAIEFLEERK
jgi:hypothetical protein